MLIEFRKMCMRSDEFDCFPTIKCFSEEKGMEIQKIFIGETFQHLNGLSEAFN